MPEESKESKAKKLAAARKKLKEYQKRGGGIDGNNGAATIGDGAAAGYQHPEHNQATGSSVSSNLSERSDSELTLNGHAINVALESEVVEKMTTAPATQAGVEAETAEAPMVPTASSYFSAAAPQSNESFYSAAVTPPAPPLPTSSSSSSESYCVLNAATAAVTLPEPAATSGPAQQQQQQNLNAIHVLIGEKAQLNAELNKYRNMCREKDFELEELRTQFSMTAHRLEELQQRFVQQQQSAEQLRNSNAELQHKLAQASATSEDQVAHLNELKMQLDVKQAQGNALEQQHKDKCNELEMAQIRIRQLSDEANISKDNRVETLTQTQFMYEQQIRDLQAMVQQLSQDKEQANIQYQNYVQHLNTEVANLNEKNAELMDESAKLQERERQLVDHISGLEREIQKNINRQDQFKEIEKQESSLANSSTELSNEIAKLNEKISDFDFERHEFQLKIKSQEDRLDTLNSELNDKRNELELLKEHLENVNSEQPDKTKLLATMESDKVAASRALTQNNELKNQLDELELRFVQLTNDKAELMNKLDSEEYANREMRTKYAEMEERLHTIDERFKFKDEEMIRLSHENMELARKNLVLEQRVDRLQHYEAKGYSDEYQKAEEGHAGHDQEHLLAENDDHDHSSDHCAASHNHNEDHDHHGDEEYCEEATEIDHSDHSDLTQQHHKYAENTHSYDHQHQVHSTTAHIATSDAVERLQQRFTQLMSQVADLTEEKQRLEHLVLQLQSETETIGEYIALYQTQRRILKQREYEKAAQMQLLAEEREQMREKITVLNNLVSSLSAELPQNVRLKEHLNAALAESPAPPSEGPQLNDAATQQQQEMFDEMALNEKLNSVESQEILTKIQNIITEIKENTREVPSVNANTYTADHLNCCMGKFEIV